MTEKDFLAFFFKRLRPNTTNRYVDDFPYLSLCGRERNFVRCDDLPIVFTHIISSKHNGVEKLSYCNGDDLLTVDFEPDKISMPQSGRIYHPGPPFVGGVGLIKSSLAVELSKLFDFENGEDNPPTHLHWNGSKYFLNNNILTQLDKIRKLNFE